MRNRRKLGYCSGERHPRVELTFHEVELIRKMHEQEGMTYAQIAEKMETPRSTIQSICRYETRVNG